MKKNAALPLWSSLLLLALSLSACQGKSAEPAPVDTSAAPATQGETQSNPGVSPVDLPPDRLDHAGDVDSVKNANKKSVPGGDVFVDGLYERPFNANTMDKYFPYLDIVDLQGFKDETWGYASIMLSNTDANGGLPGQYGVEIDTNRDGRGDWLVKAAGVSSTDWTTKGVQAWTNSNGDIGGDIPMTADKRPLGGDGYETLVFDQGSGKLNDGAWVRISATDPKTVEVAFKLSMIGDPKAYAMGAWAATNLDPALFDYNDHMTHAQAGSPHPGYDVYPLKQMAEIDNTCRLAIGFAPSGKEPGLCATVQEKVRDESGGCPFSALTAANCP